MVNRSCSGVVVASLTAILAGGILVGRADAQDLGNRDDTLTPFLKFKEQVIKFRDGAAAPDAKQDSNLLQVTARYYVYRITWKTVQDEKWTSSSGMGKVLDDFKELIDNKATASGANKDFMKLLAPLLIDRLKEVLGTKFEIYKTGVSNAALMLPTLAKCKQPAVHEFLMELLTKPDPKTGKPFHPFVRMCAVKGLREFNAPGGPELEDATSVKDQDAKKARESARLDVLAKFIEQPYPPEGQGPEYDEAYAFVRREGIKALAQMSMPMQLDKKAIKCPVAYHLLMIANGGPVAVGPPFTLSEKVEAAIGLCSLKTGDLTSKTGDPQYNAELGVYVVANVLIDFCTGYSADYRYFKLGGSKNKDDAPPLPQLPWKYLTSRMDNGLLEMQTNLKGTPLAKKVEELRTLAKPLLSAITSYQAIELTPEHLSFVASLRPASNEVYKGSKEFVVPLQEK